MAKRDYYEVLGARARRRRGGDQEGLPQARVRESSRPQSRTTPQAEQRFKEATEAYEVLRDPSSARATTSFGHAARYRAAAGGGTGLQRLRPGRRAARVHARLRRRCGGFEDLFGGVGGSPGPQPGRRPPGAAQAVARRDRDRRREEDPASSTTARARPARAAADRGDHVPAVHGPRAGAARSAVVLRPVRERLGVPALRRRGPASCASPCKTCGGDGANVGDRDHRGAGPRRRGATETSFRCAAWATRDRAGAGRRPDRADRGEAASRCFVARGDDLHARRCR